MTIKSTFLLFTCLVLSISDAFSAGVVENKKTEKKTAINRILFTNVKVFDGSSENLKNHDVLIENNLIVKVGKNLSVEDGANIIDGKGNTLMPGMHDMHVHFSAYLPLLKARQSVNPLHAGAMGILRAEQILMNGFTTVRGGGGSSKYIKTIVDADIHPGPRVLPSESWISPTGGHADFRAQNDPHPGMTGISSYNWFDTQLTSVVDGEAEIMRAVRENFRRGATQIKIMVSGGVATPTDPLHTVQFTPKELRAAVEVADYWGTYVFAHILNDRSLIMSIENGVKGLEHVPTLNNKTAKMILDTDAMIGTSVQMVLGWTEEQAKQAFPDAMFTKYKKIRAQAINMLKTMQNNPKILHRVAFSSDLVGPWENAIARDKNTNSEIGILADYFKPVEILRIFTVNGAKYNALSGPNHPYREGDLGVIKKNAYADMLLVKGNPIEDIKLLTNPEENLLIIMKNGRVYKDIL